MQSRIAVPFLLENITYLFDWPDSKLSDAEFLNLICRETGAGLLLDIENLYLNARNHDFDPCAFLDALPAGIVKEVHLAGGITVRHDALARPLLANSHSHPVPEPALDLLDRMLARQTPAVIILERDDRFDASTSFSKTLRGSVRASPMHAGMPMTKRLLDRQISLLEYLTSSAAIFGDKPASVARALCGIDRDLLHMEARFSYEKRMDKITAVFPRPSDCLVVMKSIVREFVDACPPTDIDRLVNARQFHEFLSALWRRQRPNPPYLRDVAACELACATVRATLDGEVPEVAGGQARAPQPGIRRHFATILLRCDYDIRPIFEKAVRGTIEERDTPLAVAMPPGADHPSLLELPLAVFDLLAALDDWSDVGGLGVVTEIDDLMRELTASGLLEVRR